MIIKLLTGMSYPGINATISDEVKALPFRQLNRVKCPLVLPASVVDERRVGNLVEKQNRRSLNGADGGGEGKS
jgi:hypothetical protein